MKYISSKVLKKFLMLIISTTILVIGFFSGRNINYETQWPLYEALRNTSGIVFAVMGAWIAIVYPETLKGLFFSSNRGTKDILNMLRAMSISASILAFVLVVGILAPVVRQIEVLQPHVSTIRGLSYSALSLATLIQLRALVLTLLPNYYVKTRVSNRQQSSQLLTEMTGKASDN